MRTRSVIPLHLHVKRHPAKYLPVVVRKSMPLLGAGTDYGEDPPKLECRIGGLRRSSRRSPRFRRDSRQPTRRCGARRSRGAPAGALADPSRGAPFSTSGREVCVPEGADGHRGAPAHHGVVTRQWKPAGAFSDGFRGHAVAVSESSPASPRMARASAGQHTGQPRQSYRSSTSERGRASAAERASADSSPLEDTAKAALRAHPHRPHLAARSPGGQGDSPHLGVHRRVRESADVVTQRPMSEQADEARDRHQV